MEQPLKRMNFFQGFFTQAEDWQAEQAYHREKRRLHTGHLHTPGIVPGCLQEFGVEASKDGTALLVRAGYAIDGMGRDLYMPHTTELPIIPQDYKPPTTVYVIARYNEEKIDQRPNATNPTYTGHAFIQEQPVIELTLDEPDVNTVVELARINLAKNAQRIKDSDSPTSSGPNEIDRGHVTKAGAFSGPVTLSQLGEMIKDGVIGVDHTPESAPRPSDPNVLIEKIQGTSESLPYYLVFACPEDEGQISWRLESKCEKGSVAHRLYFKNSTDRSTRVRYKVYKLNT